MRSPLSRLMAESTPYGGLTIGKTSAHSGGMGGPEGAASGACGLVASGESAAVPKPGPSVSRNSVPSRPATYRMSENPAGGWRSENEETPAGAARTDNMGGSGRKGPP